MKKIILIVMILFITSGCYDYQELNEINIISGVGIDYKDDEYEVSLEVINSEKDGTSSKISTEIIKGKDSDIADAFNEAIAASDKEVYMERIKLLILSNDVAVNGIDKLIDYTIRDIHLTNNFPIVITENVDELLNIEVDNDTISNQILNTIQTQADKNKIEDINLIACHLLSKKRDISFPFVEIVEDDKIKISDIGYFTEDKLTNYMDNKIYNFIVLDNDKTNFVNENNVITIYEKKIKYDVSKDKITINILGYGEAKEINKEYNLNDKSNYGKIEKLINEKIEDEINDFLKETYDNNSDLLGFRELYYKKYKKNIEDIDYEVKANIKLKRNGSILEVLHD